MRTASIKALLDKSKQDLTKIEREYDKSLHARMIAPHLKIDIKNLCENLHQFLIIWQGIFVRNIARLLQ